MRYRTLAGSWFGLVLLATPASAQERERPPVKWNNPDAPAIPGIEHKSYKSESMGVEVGYSVFTPPGYAEGIGRYPVIYFLHGAGGTENSDAAGFSGLVSKAVDNKAIRPTICVFPNGGMSGYADRADRKVFGETMIVKELIPLIDATYRTVASRDGRAVCGFSMGGQGAVRLAVKYPDLFSAAASWGGAFGRRDGTPNPDGPVKAAEENRDKVKGRVRVLLIAGEKDFTRPSNPPVADGLKGLGVACELKELDGVGHDLGAYHRQTGDEFVRFLAKDFK